MRAMRLYAHHGPDRFEVQKVIEYYVHQGEQWVATYCAMPGRHVFCDFPVADMTIEQVGWW